jgi:hypothetical protein
MPPAITGIHSGDISGFFKQLLSVQILFLVMAIFILFYSVFSRIGRARLATWGLNSAS